MENAVPGCGAAFSFSRGCDRRIGDVIWNAVASESLHYGGETT